MNDGDEVPASAAAPVGQSVRGDGALARVARGPVVDSADDLAALDDAARADIADAYSRAANVQIVGIVGIGAVALGALALFPPAALLAAPLALVGNVLVDHRLVQELVELGLSPGAARAAVYGPYFNAAAMRAVTEALMTTGERRRSLLIDSVRLALLARAEKHPKKLPPSSS